MGLSRTQAVLDNLFLDFTASHIITVAGTNGKGTTCAMLEAFALASQQSVGVYSSPHIHHYNERVRINRDVLDDKAHCDAFFRVDTARQDIPLTYFEFSTLAALVLLHDAKLDCIILEVGLGGRLDATNVVDCDLAIITSIGLDHQAFLGNTRALIAVEKAGIMRPATPVIIGEPQPPASLRQAVVDHNAIATWVGEDFTHALADGQWDYRDAHRHITTHIPRIPHHNAATAVAALGQLGWSLIDEQLCQCIEQTTMSGRLQSADFGAYEDKLLFDVAHNPQAAEYLSTWLRAQQTFHITVIVGMMADKDIVNTLAPLVPLATRWLCVDLALPRAIAGNALAEQVKVLTDKPVDYVGKAHDALMVAYEHAQSVDKVLVLGSFFTVSEVQAALHTFNQEV
jgi:dihydrofolate synthase/folylpolyglutamate synthase